LRASGLSSAYEAAWLEWGDENERLWDNSIIDELR